MCHLRTVQQRGAYSITSSGAGQQSWWDCETPQQRTHSRRLLARRLGATNGSGAFFILALSSGFAWPQIRVSAAFSPIQWVQCCQRTPINTLGRCLWFGSDRPRRPIAITP
jgi:hypothetical protein